MSSASAPYGIGPPQAGPLFDALNPDNAPATRLVVFDALTRLPLEPEVWYQVREYVTWALEDETAPEHLDIIEPATRVPMRSVRQLLVRMAEDGTPEERRRAALALARARESQAAGPLLALLDEESEAAEALAMIDTSAVVDELEQRWRRDGGFWLAFALARGGRTEALAAELERLSADPEHADEWLYTDDLIQLQEGLYRVGPLPEELRGTFNRTWPGWVAQHFVSDLLFSPKAPEAADKSTWTTSVADVSAAERKLVKDALGTGLPEHDAYHAEPVVKLADDLYRKHAQELERSRFDSLLVSALLLLQAGHDERQSGDDAVLLAGALGADYAPDVEGLLEAWRRCGKHDDLTRHQIAWAACRAPLSQLIERLAPEIAKEPETPARFIGAAASWAETADPPLTSAGDEPKAPELAPPTELIKDVLSAPPPPKMAPPPEMAPPNGPPMAEPELAEANGGSEPEAPAAAGPRWILVWIADAAEPEQPLQIAFRAGAVHEVAVAIGPNQEGAIAAVGGRPFDEELGTVADMEELTVTFLAPSISMQQSGSIFLPRTGTSRRVTFAVKLPTELERFDAEIRVHHKNRIVQMARLSGPSRRSRAGAAGLADRARGGDDRA